ncbi:MAG: acetylornithine deacetylase [Alphaproteobacteria bacterium]|nr:acetylornithine deacetylase [Alphaproteobacteria bacterium]
MSDAAVQLAKALIAFDTTSRGSNLALIDFAQSLIEQAGGRCRRSYDATGAKANLFTSFGPDGDGGIVLSGHTDVVPVDGQDWSSDPFDAVTRDGKLFGRGACDMKGFIAVALSLLPEIAAAKLKRPLHLALSYDEEVGCVGVTGLLEDLKRQNIRPALAIIGEPTLMKVVGAHKGGAKLVTACCGKEGHSSAPERGANAVMMAGEFVAMLDSVWHELRADADPRFDPPHSTVQANVIAGGTAVNILARQAEVTWEYRCLPDRDPRRILDRVEARAQTEILPKYQARAAEAAFRTDRHAVYPGLKMDEDSPAVALARELTGANRVEAVAYGTEAGHFQSHGIPAVVCGPGSIEQAHRPDEFVALSELDACEAFLRRVIGKATT